MSKIPNLIHGICELTLESDDPATMERFYVEVLALEELAREEDRIWLACGERTRLGLWTRGEKEYGDRGGRHVHFAFSVKPGELDALRERLARHDVEFEGPVEHDGGDRSVYFRDPAGNLLEVWDFFAREPEGVEALVD
jgi:catechol-2,3-dioxygenase